MNLKGTAIILVVCVAIAVWLSAAMSPSGRPPAIVPATPPPIDASGAALAAEIARLHERLRPDTPPRARLRNPFTFGSILRSTTGRAKSTGGAEDAAPA